MRLNHFRRPFVKSDPKIADVLQNLADALSREPLEIVDRPLPALIGFVVMIALTYLAPNHWIKIIFLRYILIALLLIAPFYITLWKRRITLDMQGLEYTCG